MRGGAAGLVACVVLASGLFACGSSKSSDGTENGGSGGSPMAGAPGAGKGAMAGGSALGGTGGTGAAGRSNGGAGTGGSGSGGESAGRGAQGGGAGSGAGGAGTPSQTLACMMYAAATCRKATACLGAPDMEPYPCADSCPDVVFSPGATRTAEGLVACADAMAAMSCDDFIAGRFPDCVTPGTKQLGEACRYTTQCQSLVCKVTGSGSGCGVCARPIDEGGDCSPPDADCRGNLMCIAGTCRSPKSRGKQPGEACVDSTECDPTNEYCNQAQLCELYPGDGEPCVNNHCTSAFYCGTDQICRARPVAGEPCGQDVSSNILACAAGLICTVRQGTDPGTCEEPVTVPVGDPCTAGNDRCVAGSACACVDTDCTTRECRVARLLGESCGAADGTCNPPLECANGVCVDVGYRSTYEAACGT